MTRSLVTGGVGFIGVNLTWELFERGHDVVVLDNLSASSGASVPEGVEFVQGDVVDPPFVEGGFDYIYHLATVASPPRFLADPIGTLRAGAEGTRQMLDWAGRDGAVFIYASTSEVYRDPQVHPQAESYFGNVDITSTRACYDEAKRYGEALAHAYRRTAPFPTRGSLESSTPTDQRWRRTTGAS